MISDVNRSFKNTSVWVPPQRHYSRVQPGLRGSQDAATFENHSRKDPSDPFLRNSGSQHWMHMMIISGTFQSYQSQKPYTLFFGKHPDESHGQPVGRTVVLQEQQCSRSFIHSIDGFFHLLHKYSLILCARHCASTW